MSSGSLFEIVHKPKTVPFGSLWVAGKLAVLPFVRARRRRLRETTFVAVTGSAAKTTTVRLLEAVLEARGSVSPVAEGRSQGLKVTKAILSTRRRHRSCVYELAAYGPGTLDEILWAFEPEVGVVTTVGRAHLSEFHNQDAIAREKTKLVRSLPPAGIAILNADDPMVRAMAEETPARVILYGRASGADVRAEDVRATFPERLSFTAVAGDETARVETRLVGEHWVTSALAAIATGRALGVQLDEAAAALARVEPVPFKLSVLETPSGATILRDDYKGTACTVPAALQALASARARRKLLVLGPIVGFDPDPPELYFADLVREARRSADLVLLVGREAEYGLGARSHPGDDSVQAFPDAAAAASHLRALLEPGDLVLVKTPRLEEHLERVSLAQVRPVGCWRPWCEKLIACDECPRLERG
jgi:UDP-N-acetylmuramoyl-tripeptide--D-alanyl-D-alanine ligase